MDVQTWWQLFCVASSLPVCNVCLMLMQVISTCCHFSLNNVPVTYFPVLTRCSLQVVDNRCFLHSLKDSLYFAIYSDCVQLWTGQLTELDGWMSTSWTSTRSSNAGCTVPGADLWWKATSTGQRWFKHIDKELRCPAVAAHTAHSNASCSTDLTCMCTYLL